MATYTDGHQYPANTDVERSDWYGVEVQHAPGYDPATTVVTGGSHTLSGPGASSVVVLEEGIHGGVAEPDWPYGDWGYHVHFSQPANEAAFGIQVTVEYTP